MTMLTKKLKALTKPDRTCKGLFFVVYINPHVRITTCFVTTRRRPAPVHYNVWCQRTSIEHRQSGPANPRATRNLFYCPRDTVIWKEIAERQVLKIQHL